MNNNNSIFSKLIPDHLFEKYKGKHFNESWYTTIINKDSNGYYYDSENKKKVLFKFRKNVISTELQQVAIDSFLQYSKKKHSNRGLAAGIPKGQKTARTNTETGQNEGQYISSNISGYFDRPLREHLQYFKKNIVCRTTAFTLNNKKKWENALPFIKKCSREYSRLGGKYYSKQKKEYSLINNNIKIPDTVFTTITSNYNFRTACHKDSGDYPHGLGNLILTGKNYTGGYLGFPQFKILIKIEPGDFLLMDVHQWHCNTPINLNNNCNNSNNSSNSSNSSNGNSSNSFRLSFVMYLRKDAVECKNKKIIDSHTYYY
jgi:hypothetical protein